MGCCASGGVPGAGRVLSRERRWSPSISSGDGVVLCRSLPVWVVAPPRAWPREEGGPAAAGALANIPAWPGAVVEVADVTQPVQDGVGTAGAESRAGNA